jgi:signal transduction histidine kinase/CheY-like chemotaxis protein/HPt (histidine-containing phosphotransfer) domain-containing protein
MTTRPDERENLQQRIQHLEEQLAAREHTEQELQTHLQHLSHMAQNAIAQRSELLANMSHKIRTPLNAVIAMTELLLESDLAPQQREFVEMIQAGGNSLIAMVNDILDLSRIEADQFELTHQPFNLHTCVEEALDIIAARAAEKPIDLMYNIDDQTPVLLVGDADRLRQVLIHLLSNAIKFTDKGEVVLLITSRPVQEPADEPESTSPATSGNPSYRLFITVRDTGIGMTQDIINTLTHTQEETPIAATPVQGSGFGLMLSKRLIEMMQGTIQVRSQPGKGTTLHMTVLTEALLTSGPQDIPQALLDYPLAPTETSPELTGKRILIVDDNATSRSILTRKAHTWGMTPLAVTSGPEALEGILQGETFDVALLDLHMPQMDGLSLAARIRLHLDAEALPIILITAFGGEVVRDPEIEIAALLTRPIKPITLYQTLVYILTKQEKSATPQPEAPPSEPKSEHADDKMAERMPLRILLAEDNRINQKVALSLLKRLGYRADLATDGLEVLESLARQTYDIVLMDVQMPEMDGVQATQHIRRFLPAEKQPRIAAMTAHALQGDREHYLAQGMDDYISKPVKLQDLVAVLSKTAKQKEAGTPVHGEDPAASALPVPPSSASHLFAQRPGEEPFPLDVAVLEQFLGGIRTLAPQLANELINTLLYETPRTLQTMRQAIAENNPDDLYNAARTFKPQCAQFGAMTMMILCQELETISRSDTLGGAEERVNQLEREFTLVKEALEAMRGKHINREAHG